MERGSPSASAARRACKYVRAVHGGNAKAGEISWRLTRLAEEEVACEAVVMREPGGRWM